MTQEKLGQALEMLLSDKYKWTIYSDIAYTVVENILTEWVVSFDSYETYLDETVQQELESALVYYRDVYGYLEQRRVWNIEEAVGEGFGNNIGSIAYYFLRDEVYSILSKLDLY